MLDEDEDSMIYGKINEIQNELRNQQEPEGKGSAVTFNNDTQHNTNPYRGEGSRPSDVVNFEDKSDHQDKSHEDLQTQEVKNYGREREESDPQFYSNEGVENPPVAEIDYDNAKNEIENQLQMINQEIDQIKAQKKEESEDEQPDKNIEVDISQKFKRSPDQRSPKHQQREQKQSRKGKRSNKKWERKKPKNKSVEKKEELKKLLKLYEK